MLLQKANWESNDDKIQYEKPKESKVGVCSYTNSFSFIINSPQHVLSRFIDNMDQLINSDEKMAASLTFQHILTQIQDSNLNFQLQVSPFAAVISLKKSFVKDKSGVPLPRMRHLSDTSSKIEALEVELSSMHNEYMIDWLLKMKKLVKSLIP